VFHAIVFGGVRLTVTAVGSRNGLIAWLIDYVYRKRLAVLCAYHCGLGMPWPQKPAVSSLQPADLVLVCDGSGGNRVNHAGYLCWMADSCMRPAVAAGKVSTVLRGEFLGAYLYRLPSRYFISPLVSSRKGQIVYTRIFCLSAQCLFWYTVKTVISASRLSHESALVLHCGSQ